MTTVDFTPWTLATPTSLNFLASNFRQAYLDSISKHGERPFVTVFSDRLAARRATFQEFHGDVERVAHSLSADGGASRIIVTLAGNSYLHLVYIVATLVSGRTLCPISPEEGQARIERKIKALGEPVTVFADSAVTVSAAREMRLEGLPRMPLAPAESARPDEPLVLIFTSGSTGFAKIVEQTELGILTNVDALIERHGLSPLATVGTPLPISHVNALEFSFFASLLSGASLVLWERVVFPQFWGQVVGEKCTLLSLVPPVLRALVFRATEIAQSKAPDLKYFVSAAAPLSRDLALQVTQTLKIPVIQGYGLSEAVNFSCLMPTDMDAGLFCERHGGYRSPSIGTALRGTEVAILDAQGQTQGPGDVGEVCIRGPTVMRGYRNEPNSKVFAHGYLHTGDIGYFEEDPQGRRFYFVTGRMKETIKRNGLTVSLREVDEILALFPEPSFEAICVSFRNEISGEEIGLVAHAGGGWTADLEARLISYLEANLPPFMRPHVVFQTDQRIRSASGKVQRHRFSDLFLRFGQISFGASIRFFVDPTPGGAQENR